MGKTLSYTLSIFLLKLKSGNGNTLAFPSLSRIGSSLQEHPGQTVGRFDQTPQLTKICMLYPVNKKRLKEPSAG